MNLRALLAAAVLLPAGASFAAVGDPCTPDVVDADGNVTTDNFTEVCDTTNAIFCAVPQAGGAAVETALNCAALFAGAPVGTCEDFAGFGPTCSFLDGDACSFASADNPFIPFACQTDTSGCINGQCTPDLGTCIPDSPSVCAAGGASAFCAPWNQLVGNTCDGWVQLLEINDGGGTLSCTGAGTCTGVGTGGDCNDADFTCATDTCVAGVCGGAAAEGEGEGEPAEGEGEGEGGRDDQPEPAPAGCFNALGALPAFGPLALVLLALRRRRA